MEINIITSGKAHIAEITGDHIFINHTEEAIQLMMDCKYAHDTYKAILYQENITPDFFELRTKLAGEILQKFTQYGFDIAIVGDFSIYGSKSLNDFIFESNKHGKINFVDSREKALEKLTSIQS